MTVAGGPRCVWGTMAKDVGQMMDELRLDTARWRVELVQLRLAGYTETVKEVEKLIADAEMILARWESRH